MHRFQDIALRQPPLRAVHLNRRIFLIANLIVFLAFSASWIRYPRVWAESREHGFLIAGLCVWLVWRDRQRLMEPSSPMSGGLPLIALASMAWWVAIETGLQVVHLSMAVAVGLLWIGAARGVSALRATLPIAATFALAIPVWEILVPLLQGLTVAVSQLFLRIAGIHAEIQQNLIILRSGVVEVADTCSGLNFFLVGTSIALCYAHLFLRTRQQRFIAVAIGSGLSIAANWVRVIGLVVIADITKMKSPLMRDHEVYGWAIFTCSVLLFFAMAHRLESSAIGQSPQRPERLPAYPAPDPSPLPALACALIGPVLAVTIALLPIRSSAGDDAIAVNPGPEWLSDATPNRRLWRPDFEGAPKIETQTFTADGVEIVRDRIRYDQQRDGAEVVSASNRLVGSAKIVDERDVGPLDANLRVVHQTIARDSLGAFVAWSWYRVAGTDTPLPLKAKLLQIVATITRHLSAEVVIVSARCSPTSCKEASESLFRFVTGHASSTVNSDGSTRMLR